MEKIQIQFKESDYKVYHEYCLKYYQVHDSIRKQSIQAFLDLYEKGILIIEEQDILPARQLIAEKCDLLKKEHSSPGIDTTILLQLRVCSDIQLFIEDLEKIYRLIKRQDVTANYLMILATFSRVIRENRSSQPPVIFDLDNAEIESLARPVADAIRRRMGTNPEWHYVLRELTSIAAQFNQRSPELKFDRDIIQLVAPSVVSCFDQEVTPREVLSVLPSYAEESELEEFESFLNHTPDHAFEEQDTDIDWDTIYIPLENIAAVVAAQREQWYSGHPKISDRLLSEQSSGVSYQAKTPYPARYPRSPMVHDGYKTFDISVGRDVIEKAEYTLPENPPPEPVPEKPGMPPWIPFVIGALLVLVVVFATVVFSGYLDQGKQGNSTNPPLVTSTTAPAPVMTTKTAVPTTQATTAAATKTPTAAATATPVPAIKSYSPTDVGNHLIDIAFGPDYNVIKKPIKNPVRVSCEGMYDARNIVLLTSFIGQFNNLSSTTKISEYVETESTADIALELLPENSIDQISVDDDSSVVYRDMWTGSFYFVRTDKKTYVSSDLKGAERDRWILRALLNNLGFYGETAKYSDSLFYAGENNASEPTTIDWKAIQLMYGKKVKNGMTKASVKTVI